MLTCILVQRNTACFLAASFGKAADLRILVAAGCDITIKDHVSSYLRYNIAAHTPYTEYISLWWNAMKDL